VQPDDIKYVVRWVAAMCNLPEESHPRLKEALLLEWASAAELLHPISWIATTPTTPLFLLDFVPEQGVHLIGPPIIFDHPRLAPETWRIVRHFLKRLDRGPS
jgi:hypothetical protein